MGVDSAGGIQAVADRQAVHPGISVVRCPDIFPAGRCRTLCPSACTTASDITISVRITGYPLTSGCLFFKRFAISIIFNFWRGTNTIVVGYTVGYIRVIIRPVSTTTVYLITCCCSAGMATVGCIIPIFSITFLRRRYYAVATTYRFVFQTRSATTTTCRGCRICKVILTFRRYTIFTSSCPITIPCSGGTICRVIVCIKV